MNDLCQIQPGIKIFLTRSSAINITQVLLTCAHQRQLVENDLKLFLLQSCQALQQKHPKNLKLSWLLAQGPRLVTYVTKITLLRSLVALPQQLFLEPKNPDFVAFKHHSLGLFKVQYLHM